MCDNLKETISSNYLPIVAKEKLKLLKKLNDVLKNDKMELVDLVLDITLSKIKGSPKANLLEQYQYFKQSHSLFAAHIKDQEYLSSDKPNLLPNY